MLETLKLLGSTKSKITKDENGENMPHLEITEVVLVNYNICNNYYHAPHFTNPFCHELFIFDCLKFYIAAFCDLN